MWERMMDAGLLVAGAIVLFVLFTTVLFIYERKEQKKSDTLRTQLRVIRCEKQKRAA